MLRRCSEFSASSLSMSAAWERRLDWSISRWRWQGFVVDSSWRFVAVELGFEVRRQRLG